MSFSEHFSRLRGLKVRHLIGQSVRAVIFVDKGGMRSEGPTPIVFVYVFRCRTYSAPIPANRHITALTDRPIRCRAFATITDSEKEILSTEFPAGQFGNTELLSGALFNKRYTTRLWLHPLSGAVEKLEAEQPK